ncbi:MAG: hypothetical protein IKA54_04440 [Clostridia bacterium]|nr:hypothetical protein [Clostridia bacterium]
MKTAKEISLLGVFIALLIGGQFALSAVSGVEVVTVLAVSFFYFFGIKRGVVLATAFSLLRCLVFGFFANVVILYLVYYNALAVLFGLIGRAFNKKTGVKEIVIVTLTAVVCTVLFTVLDNLISYIYFGLTQKAFEVYFKASLLTMIPQVICVAVTVPLLFYPLTKIYKTINL